MKRRLPVRLRRIGKSTGMRILSLAICSRISMMQTATTSQAFVSLWTVRESPSRLQKVTIWKGCSTLAARSNRVMWGITAKALRPRQLAYCGTSALRRWRCPTIRLPCCRISDEPVAGTDLYPLVYDFFTTDVPCNGTELILTACQARLRDALRTGLTHFFYEENPLLGELLWASLGREFSMYASAWVTQGCVFYRNLRRGVIPHLPVVLVVNREYKQIEKQISNDRDRNFFGEKLMASFYNVFAKSPLRYDTQGLQVLLDRARPCWNQGHPLIAEIARASCSWDQAAQDGLFQGKYFARSFARDAARQMEYQHVERQWQQKGLLPLPAYFASFGLSTAEEHLRDLERKGREQARRRPSPAEANSIEMLRQTLRELRPEIVAVFDAGKTTYTVAKSEAFLGELRDHRHYSAREVFLAADGV